MHSKTFFRSLGLAVGAALMITITTAAMSMQQTPPPAAPQGTPPTAPPKKPDSNESPVKQMPSRAAPVSPGNTASQPPMNPRLRPDATAPAGNAVAPINLQQGNPGANDQNLDTTPVIEFVPPQLDLGDMIVDTAKSGTIKLHNISDKPVTILKAVPSCGCTTAGWPKDPIPPGESAEVEITLKPGSKAGIPLNKKVTFQIQDHAPIMLTVTGFIPEFVHISPEILEEPGTGPNARPVVESVKLTAVQGEPFKVVNITPDIVNDEDAKAAAESAKTEHQLRIDWKKWADTGKSFKVQFNLDHPKAPQLSVMVKRAIPAGQPSGPTPTPTPKVVSTLINAARGGDLDRVKLEIANGADVNQVDPGTGRSPLHWAARENKKEVVKALLDAKANVEIKDRAGKTPLTFAAESGSVDTLKMLMDAKADINSRDLIQGSPLLWAAALAPTPETAKILLAAGADPNVVDINGLTPLLWVAGIGDAGTVKALLDSGKVNIEAADRISEDTALMRACRSGKIESLGYLLEKHPKLETRNRQGMTAWLLVCSAGNLAKVKAMYAAKPDLLAKDQRGWNALDHARNRTDQDRAAVIDYLENELKIPASGAAQPPQVSATAKGPVQPVGDGATKAPAVPVPTPSATK